MALVKQGPDVVRDAVYGRFQRLPRTILSAPVPVFAAVDGPAVGLGMDLALMCDDRFIGPKGWLRQGWGALGLVPGTGGELLLRRLAPNLIWQLLGSGERRSTDLRPSTTVWAVPAQSRLLIQPWRLWNISSRRCRPTLWPGMPDCTGPNCSGRSTGTSPRALTSRWAF